MSSFLILLLLKSLSLTVGVHAGAQNPFPTEYRHTLSDFSQNNIRHCSSLPPNRDRLLCEFEGALDAQARSNHAKPFNPSDYPLPGKRGCKFKKENLYNLYPNVMPPSPTLDRVLDKYTAMHSRCRDAEFDKLDDMYAPSKSLLPFRTRIPEKPICQYVIWKPSPFGFDNQLLCLISSFLYAIMSARVLLVDHPDWNELFCEPFWNSSIQLPPGTKLSGERGPYYVKYRDARCGSSYADTNATDGGVCNTNAVNTVLDGETPTREYEFVSCPMGYARLRNVPFVMIRGCNEYLVPGFYVNPLLSPLLDALFPQRNPFNLLSRFLYTPTDEMWDAIKSRLDLHARRRVGVQLREFKWKQYTAEYHRNVIRCIKNTGGFLPRMFRKKGGHAGGYVGVYVATLVKRHLQGLNSSLREYRKETGNDFKLSFQMLDTEDELHDVKQQKEAMIDMWALSMSHVLIASKGSTFGYIASSLAGVSANFLESEEGKGCLIGLGVEPCLHVPPERHSCRLQEPATLDLHDVVQRSSTVRVCNDRGYGWTVVPPA